MGEIVKAAQKMGQGKVAVAGCFFGKGYRLVDVDISIIGSVPDEIDQLSQCLRRGTARQNNISNNNGAGIDEGITRYSLFPFKLQNRVKSVA